MNRTFTLWAAGSLVGAIALVGGAKVIEHDAPVRDVGAGAAGAGAAGASVRECTMADGTKGYEYTPGLCTLNPPFASTPSSSG